METIKNIAAILGAILSLSAVITLCCKPIQAHIAKKIIEHDNRRENEIHENTLKATLDRLEDKIDSINDSTKATIAYTTEACRSEIKNMFYRYLKDKTLPLYEKKHMIKIEDIYVNTLHENHYTKGLIDEMKTWSVDYTGARSEDVD